MSSQRKPGAVLGIESSCDDTGVAVYDPERGGLLAHHVHSQSTLHAVYGGVVPELASRDHIRVLVPLIRQVTAAAGLHCNELGGIAYTRGPGLAGALLVGASTGRSLAYALGIPAIGVHHMEGHLLASMLEPVPLQFPFLALLVSGGHTLLVRVAAPGDYHCLGQTLDDAAGEALDKTARLLGLDYPGGAALSRLAEQGRPGACPFPVPMRNRPGLDFSFSGLKTRASHAVEAAGADPQARADVARGFLDAVIGALLHRLRRALQQHPVACVVAGGGVCANPQLREQLLALGREQNMPVRFPSPEFCTDNGAMIACAGYLRLCAGERAGLDFHIKPGWPLHSAPMPTLKALQLTASP